MHRQLVQANVRVRVRVRVVHSLYHHMVPTPCDAKVSDGISMGLGDYLSERSEKDYIHQGVCPRQPCPYSLGIYGTLPGLRLRMQCVLRAYHLPRASLSQ